MARFTHKEIVKELEEAISHCPTLLRKLKERCNNTEHEKALQWLENIPSNKKGGPGRLSKTDDDTRRKMIDRYKKGETIDDIAREHQLCYTTARQIIRAGTKLRRKAPLLTEKEKKVIRKRYANGESGYRIALDYPHVSERTVYRACR
jgi:hypothetical protein